MANGVSQVRGGLGQRGGRQGGKHGRREGGKGEGGERKSHKR